jgi:hypothetical protein
VNELLPSSTSFFRFFKKESQASERKALAIDLSRNAGEEEIDAAHPACVGRVIRENEVWICLHPRTWGWSQTKEAYSSSRPEKK